MTTDQALQTAIARLPGIPQDPTGYGLMAVDDFTDFTVYRFTRTRLHPNASQIIVRVEDNRLTTPHTAHASYQVI